MEENGRAIVAGVVGLGAIGGHVARALSRSGFRVFGYDVRPSAFGEFPEAEPCASVQALAEQADLVLIAVFDDAQLRDVLAGSDGIPGAAAPPSTVCVLSTVTLGTLHWAADKAKQSHVELIDCGVTGGNGLRSRGKIVVLAGGSDEALEAARPVLEAFAAPLMHMGPLGAGMQAKLARNLMFYTGWYAAWEAACIAEGCGIDIGKLVEAHRISNELSDAGGGTTLLSAGIRPGPVDLSDEASLERRRRSAAWAKKDLSYVLELAETLGIPLPGAHMVRERIDFVVGLAETTAANEATESGETPAPAPAPMP